MQLNIDNSETGKTRYILKGGLIRRSQQILLRDTLTASGHVSPFEFAQAGRGPVALMHEIRKQITEGYRYWIVCDVENCFASCKPQHFEWLNVKSRSFRNAAFGAQGRIAVKNSSLTEKVFSAGHIKTARHRLSLGAMTSPQLASALIGRELQALPGDWRACSWIDDIALGARSREGIQVIAEALRKRLAELSAGPLVLRTSNVFDARLGVNFMHLRFKWRHKKGNMHVHVCPSPKAFKRFYRRVGSKFVEYDEKFDSFERDELLEQYGLRWSSSVQWRRPNNSHDVQWITDLVRAETDRFK